MQKIVIFNGEEIPYEFSRGGVKNINAHVRRDGTLYVSAPRLLPFGRVERFLAAHIAQLLPVMRARAQAKAEGAAPLQTGQAVLFMGARYPLRLCVGRQRFVDLQEGELCVCRRENDGEEIYRTLLAAWLTEQAKTEIENLCLDLYNEFFASLFPLPTVRFRRMIGRWGSCHKQKAVLTFNTRLIYADKNAIAYVVLHELTHMLHPDHSPRFYAALAARMPDYKTHRAALAKIDLARENWI